MQVLLVNQNATIERLVSLSTGKLLYQLDKVAQSTEAESKDYDFIIIDSDLYDAESFQALKNMALGATVIMTVAKNFEKPAGVDIFIEKPFLPTELVEILSSARTVEPLPKDEDLSDLASLDDLHSELPSFDDTTVAHDDLTDLSDSFDVDDKIDLAEEDDEIRLDNIEVPGISDEVSIGEHDDNDSAVDLDDLSFDSEEEALSTDVEDLGLDELGIDLDEPVVSDLPSNSAETSADEVEMQEDEVAELELDPSDLDLDTEEAVMPEEHTLDDDSLPSLDDEIELDEPIVPEASDEPLPSFDELELGSLDLDEHEVSEDEVAAEEPVQIQDDEIALDDDLNLDELTDDIAISEDDISLDDDLASLDEPLELDVEADVEEDSKEDEDAKQEPELSAEEQMMSDFAGLDDDFLESSLSDSDEIAIEENAAESEPELPKEGADEDGDEEKDAAPKVPASIFGDDEVQKLKALLGEDEEEHDDMEADSEIEELIDIPASEGLSESCDEFGEMSEAGVAEALGVEYSPSKELDDELALEDLPDVPMPVKHSDSVSTQSIEISGSELLSMPIDRLKELLEAADITINITLKKKS